MKEADQNVLLGLVAIAVVLYLGWPAKAKGDAAGDPLSGRPLFVPGGGDATSGYGVTGSWDQLKTSIL